MCFVVQRTNSDAIDNVDGLVEAKGGRVWVVADNWQQQLCI
jgi:hypothetical protein